MSETVRQRRARLLASGCWVADDSRNILWQTRAEFAVGDEVTHDDGYNCTIGVVRRVIDKSFRNENAPDGWCHGYDYVVEWPPNPAFSSYYAEHSYTRRTTGNNLIAAREARHLLEREGSKRGWSIGRFMDQRYQELHMEMAPGD